MNALTRRTRLLVFSLDDRVFSSSSFTPFAMYFGSCVFRFSSFLLLLRFIPPIAFLNRFGMMTREIGHQVGFWTHDGFIL